MARRKRKKFTEAEPKIKEYKGYKVGDTIYAKIVSGEMKYGKIHRFYPEDKLGPAFSFVDFTDYKYHVSLMKWIEKDPSPAQKRKAKR